MRRPWSRDNSHLPPAALSLEQTVRAWHAVGHSQRAIARELNIDRRKVRQIIERAA
jgi:DNA-binding CsgD family transcriptional regulator